MSYRGPPPGRRGRDRGYHDYDQPQQASARYRDYPEEREDDFSIRGRATMEARARERSPPRRGDTFRGRDEGPRQRDSRYDSRSYHDDGDFRGGRGQARHQYDRNTRDGRNESYRGRDHYESVRYDERRSSYDPTVEAQPDQRSVEPAYNGEKDLASDDDSTRLNFLLVRGLKLSVNAEVFAKGMEKLYSTADRPEGAAPGSLRCVMLICERGGDSQRSLGFGFAWYHSYVDAEAALALAKKLGTAFTISSRDVSVDRPHNGVFPRTDFAMRNTKDRFTFVMPGTGLRHEYKDARFYPVEHVVNSDPPEGSRPSNSPSVEEKHASTLPSDKKPKKRVLDASDAESGSKKRVQMSASLQSLTNRWGQKHAELRDETEPEPETESAVVVSQYVQTFVSAGIGKDKKKACWLCGNELNDNILYKHNAQSSKHAAALKDANKVQQAFKKMAAQGIDPDLTLNIADVPGPPRPSTNVDITTSSGAVQAPEYIDRAARRRADEARTNAVSDTSAPAKMSLSLKNAKRNQSSAGKSDDSAPAPMSKGLNMLQKHGYKAGEGLGASGNEGTTAPIPTDLYAANVGLGHVSGKIGDAVTEAEKATKGAYVEKVKDGAKARYEAALGKEAAEKSGP